MSVDISVRNLEKRYKKRIVINNISLDIENEIFAYLGPNGAGKTTFVNILCGLIKRDAGSVTVFGMDPHKNVNSVRSQIGLVPQETSLYEYLTALENLEFHAKFYGVPKKMRKKRIFELLELVQLKDRAKDLVHTFSGGMKRRLALIRALLHNPRLLILDEPTLGIDVQNRNEIWNRILELKREKTILINTNYMEEADRVADRCAIIDNGKIVALDSPEQLKVKYAGGSQVKINIKNIGETELKQLYLKLQKIPSDVTIVNGSYVYKQIIIRAKMNVNTMLTEISNIINKFKKIELKNIEVYTPTLNEVFLELTGKNLRD